MAGDRDPAAKGRDAYDRYQELAGQPAGLPSLRTPSPSSSVTPTTKPSLMGRPILLDQALDPHGHGSPLPLSSNAAD